MQLLEDTPAVLSLGKLCEEHGYTSEWASGQKPHLTKYGKTFLCKTKNFLPVAVPGLSSSSSTSSSSASLPQDSSSSADPANLRSDEGVSGIWRKPPEKQKMETAREQRETACETSQNGQRSSQIILRMQKYPQPQTFLTTQIGNVLSKWHPRSTSASEPK